MPSEDGGQGERVPSRDGKGESFRKRRLGMSSRSGVGGAAPSIRGAYPSALPYNSAIAFSPHAEAPDGSRVDASRSFRVAAARRSIRMRQGIEG